MSRHRTATVVLVVLVLAVALVRVTLVAPVRIASASMSPTLDRGDVVLVSRRRPVLAALHRGDIVVVRVPGRRQHALKRLVGLPGESLVVLDGRLVVDGAVVREPYVDHARVDGYFSATFDVPLEAVFVMGDNRGNSVDSRDYGPVPARDVVGRMLRRLW